MYKFFSTFIIISSLSVGYATQINPDVADNVRTGSPETFSERAVDKSDNYYAIKKHTSYYPFIYLINYDPKLHAEYEKNPKLKHQIYYLPNDAKLERNKLFFATEDFEKEVYLCPPEKKQDKESIAELEQYYWSSKYCLLQKRENELIMCTREPTPLLIKPEEKRSKTSPFPRYQFAYHFCQNGEVLKTWLKNKSTCLSCITEILGISRQVPYSPGGFWRFYNIFYDTEKQRTAYTAHYIMTPRLLQNQNILPAPRFDIKKISTESYNFPELGTHFNAMDTAFYTQDEGSIFYFEKELMVPIEDFAVDVWKKTTLHYINVAPLYEPLSWLMYLFNERVRQMAILISKKRDKIPSLPKLHFKEGFLIHTTTIILPKFGDDRQLYLDKAKKFPVPDVWVKHVYFVKDKLAIALYIHNTPQIPPKNRLCAETVDCDFQAWGRALDPPIDILDENAQYGYCCKVDDQINALFHEKFPVEGVLEINTLTYSLNTIDETTTDSDDKQKDKEKMQEDENEQNEWGPNYPLN